ncbi:MAG: hypothetical protein ACD_50C00389G0004 [uncultured bacterium]|nr:MAG: hypothetical protein ACD_50C00389G0004 [uncultured bacterium]
MSLRSIVREIQKGSVNIAINNLLTKDSLLRMNSAPDLIEFMAGCIESKDRPYVSICAQKTYCFSHFKNTNLYENVLSNIDAGGPVVVISHQPTIFPYSGVYVQFLLADFLVRKLKASYGLNTSIIYLCLDSDDAFDRRIKTAHFPFPVARKGSVPISYEMYKFCRNVPQFCVPYIDNGYRNNWKKSILGAFDLLASFLPNMKIEIRNAKKKFDFFFDELFEETTMLKPESFSDFSLSIIMGFVKKIIDTPVIPLRYSDLFNVGRQEVVSALKRWKDIVRTGRQLLNKYNLEKISIFDSYPTWGICKRCYFRNSITYDQALEALSGNKINVKCERCLTTFCELDVDFLIMPKVILEDILGVVFTGANLVLTYAGSTQHVVLSNSIIENVFKKKSPIFTWHPKHFLGTVLDKSCVELLQRDIKGDSSLLALQRATEGRDTLLYLFDESVIQRMKKGWGEHFLDRKLSDRMVCTTKSDIYSQFIKVLKW